ncbi:uncharacterized protein LOC110035944 [Phalaenopsis equestris]|uniref:uncharacterized protein LOC110035944 n=1 Tax=Phalaenopsis equestris TaxID=78828 RepID=UPI0009E48A10|nr:uncharacterized protein LOC110035944 [Phalaenopsis equestris]
MEHRKSWQVPTFGDWDYGDQMPITQYFESARQAGLVRAGSLAASYEEDLFNVPVAMPVKLAYQDGLYHRKVRDENGSGREKKSCSKEQKQRKQGRASAAGVVGPPRKPIAAPKAVDEDLYKIPPELLRRKPKKKTLVRNLFLGCLGLNCVA